MGNVSRDFVSVDMQGMKAGLLALARSRRVALSAIVRAAVSRELGLEVRPVSWDSTGAVLGDDLVKASIRLSSAEALLLATRARAAGLSRGAYVGALVSGAAVLPRRKEHLAALTATCGELATLSRNLYHLTALLRKGSMLAAEQYTGMLDSLRADVRGHLQVAADALAGLRPRSGGAVRPRRTRGRRARNV